MALRNILNKDDELLTKKSKPVLEYNKRLLDLLDDMAETMKKADGIGLAAPQVGILKRVAVIDIGDGLIELINPEIIECKGEQINQEGCLSCPNEYGYVVRPYKVKVSAFNRKGEKIIVKGQELLARALCHEIDHLDGVLFLDKVVAVDLNEKPKKVKVTKKK